MQCLLCNKSTLTCLFTILWNVQWAVQFTLRQKRQCEHAWEWRHPALAKQNGRRLEPGRTWENVSAGKRPCRHTTVGTKVCVHFIYCGVQRRYLQLMLILKLASYCRIPGFIHAAKYSQHYTPILVLWFTSLTHFIAPPLPFHTHRMPSIQQTIQKQEPYFSYKKFFAYT